MPLIILNMVGWLVANWRKVAIALAVVIVLFSVAALWRACKPKDKIDGANIQKINSVDRKERVEEIERVLTENSNVVKTVDNRTTIAETNVVERNRELDEKIKDADRKIAEAKKAGGDITSEQLECILIPENCQ